ncbi:unnamed protein product [Rhizophagus irregularis]|nr:unnamed protein product [Rhizophagus irregularis]
MDFKDKIASSELSLKTIINILGEELSSRPRKINPPLQKHTLQNCRYNDLSGFWIAEILDCRDFVVDRASDCRDFVVDLVLVVQVTVEILIGYRFGFVEATYCSHMGGFGSTL